jgi:hypothetical protein
VLTSEEVALSTTISAYNDIVAGTIKVISCWMLFTLRSGDYSPEFLDGRLVPIRLEALDPQRLFREIYQL